MELCSTFNIKTAPLIRPILGSTEGGLHSGLYCISYVSDLTLIVYHNTATIYSTSQGRLLINLNECWANIVNFDPIFIQRHLPEC